MCKPKNKRVGSQFIFFNMKHLPIVPFIFSFLLLLTVGCQEVKEVLPKNQLSLENKSVENEINNIAKIQNSDVLELNIPHFFTTQLDEFDANSGWVNINNPSYKGELMITTGSNGYISSIKVRGDIVNHVESNYLTNVFGDVNVLRWDDPIPKKEPLKCFGDCMRGQPLNSWVVAFCIAACALQQI